MTGLYHYTTGAGLLGMLKNYSGENPHLTMWATHYMYMNDPMEYIYGQNICLDIIDEIENELGVNENDRIKKIIIWDEYQKAIKDVKRTKDGYKICPFLISMSRAFDSLHMWDMYATKGNGIAINFNENKLTKAYVHLKECNYHTREDNAFKQRIKEHYEELITEVEDGPNLIEKVKRAHYIFSVISLFLGIRIKHEAYEMEQEVRITPIDKKTLLFRERDGLIIPYVETKIPFDCVESIIVGPTADFNRVCESILLLLNSRGIKWDENKILKSNVPYRE